MSYRFSHLHRMKRRQTEEGDLNLTPMIDVMTVLLTVFMVTAPLLTSGLNLNLPKGGQSTLSGTNKLQISIDRTGQLYLLNDKVSKRELLGKLKATTKNNKDLQLIINADKAIPYGKVIEVMGLLKDDGWEKVGLRTSAVRMKK